MNQNLLRELTNLRDRLKNNSGIQTGRVATICSDKALLSLAEKEPRSLNEMLLIDGVGKTFVDNYGDQFLEIIEKYHQNDVHTMGIQMDDRKANLLKELEKNLVDISKRNKLLYLAKSSAKHAQDLYDGSYDVRDLIFGKVNSILICDRDSNPTKYTRISGIIKEANRDIREKGRNDLYIGYPFVKGRIYGDRFDVRAPLVLIPIIAEKKTDSITISLDDDRDVLYNNTLILTHYKLNNVRKPLPAPEMEEVNGSTFIGDILDHYRSEGMNIRIPGDNVGLIEFQEYKADEFPKYDMGEMYLENVATIGKFTIISNSIHRDYDRMIESNEINELIDHLLDSPEIDDSISGFTEDKETQKEPLKESDIVYINSLNASQERVLKTIDIEDEVVIHGPPGTGKSQTIASLIVDSVNKGRTVLMVSEKKTALDVIHSRLGTLSKYAIQIDDIGDKESFYKKMDDIINMRITEKNPCDIAAISEAIDSRIRSLETLANRMYSPDDFGIEPYKLFHFDIRCDTTDDVQYQIHRTISSDPNIRGMRFDELQSAHERFSDTKVSESADRYIQYMSECPVLKEFGKGMNGFDVRAMQERTTELSKEVETWKNKFILLRLLGKRGIRKKAEEYASKYLPRGNHKESADRILESGTDDIEHALQDYDDFLMREDVYESLNDIEKMYFDTLTTIRTHIPDIDEANVGLYKQTIGWHMEDFRANNRNVLKTIDQFDDIIKEVTELTERKRAMSIEMTDSILQRHLVTNIINQESKAGKEIRRRVEQKRKKSVHTFMSMFPAQLFNGIKIWLMTPEVVSEIVPFEKGRFDLVIFDEASQMYREKGLPAIYRSKKVVIAGDDKQLRPSSLFKGRFDSISEDDDEEEVQDAILEETSLLDLAKSKYKPVLLDYHYRSKYEELINFSNYAFYKARLYVSPNVTQPDEPPIKMHIVDGVWADRSNKAEAFKVVELVKDFFARRMNNETIGIITFNIEQRDLVEKLLENECAVDPAFAAEYETEIVRKENGEDVGLFIRSIENVQGDERDEIIFSVGYAKDSDGRFRRNFGSLSVEGGENRLNVAITRSKKRIQVVTSMNPKDFDVSGLTHRGPFILKKYLEYSYAISNGDYDSVKRILNSFHDEQNPGNTVRFDSKFEEEVYDALMEKGLLVDTQIGVGGYSIDLAVKKDGRYVLGIECDGKLYHSSATARERDYHRQKYLESRGWIIHRIWSTNWWADRSREIEKIVNLVDVL